MTNSQKSLNGQEPDIQWEDNFSPDTKSWLKILTTEGMGLAPERAITQKKDVRCGRVSGKVINIEFVLAHPDQPPHPKTNPELPVMLGEFEGEAYSDDGEVTEFFSDRCALPIGQTAFMVQLQQQIDGGAERPLVVFDIELWARPSGNPSKRTWGARNFAGMAREHGDFLSQQNRDRRRELTNAAAGVGLAKAIEHDKPL